MIRFPCPLHAPQDDLAPRDYSYVRSVSEGRRRAQLQNIHHEPAPEPPIARPQVDEYGIPENPYLQQAPAMQPVRRSRAARNVTQPVVQPSEPTFAPQQQPAPQPQFAAPVSPEIPDWLRVAQQNNMPMQNRPQGPRVQAAPRQPVPQERPARRPTQQPVSPYEAAGYPAHLLEEQRQMEREQAAIPVRRRHGAQYATRPQYQPQQPVQPTGMSYPPPRVAQQPAPEQPPQPMRRGYMHQPQPQQQDNWQVETDDEPVRRELPGWMHRVPWLAVAAFAVVLAAVLIWIFGMNYEKQTQQVLDQRAAQLEEIIENHPLKYKELITEKSGKYNLAPAFVAAIIMNESSFRPDAVAESTGARGLMQLVYDTAEWVHSKLNPGTEFRHNDLHDPALNMEYGCWYLNYLAKLFGGDPVLVAAAFHAGQGEVRSWLTNAAYSTDGRTVAIDNIPFGDTRRYVTRVMEDYAIYLREYYGR